MQQVKSLCLTVLFGIFFLPTTLFATHQAGVDLTYTCLGSNQYEITFTLYRDCSGVSPLATQTIDYSSVSCGISSSVILNQVPGSGQEITVPCSSNATTCSTPPGNDPGVQKYEYSGIINLQACNDWVFGFMSCCRNCAITTIDLGTSNCVTYPDIYVESHLDNLNFPCNSSPVFTNDPLVFVCSNQSFTYNHGVIDPDGDSLVYTLVNPLTEPTMPVVYLTGYSATNPITSNPPLTLDPVTGDINMTPTTQEVSVMAVLVEEYRNGQLVGSVVRDMQIWVLNCSNNLPTATGINGSSSFSISVCSGDNLSFDIFSGDVDPGDIVSMSWNQAIPNATFNASGTPLPAGTFNWTPQNTDVSPNPHSFTVTVRDDACPTNGVQVYSYNITVQNCCDTLVLATQSSNLSCNGDCTGVVSVAAGGGIPPYTYSWSTGQSGALLQGLCAGVYAVTVVDVNGCTDSTTVTIMEPDLLTLAIQSMGSRCLESSNGSADALVTGGTLPYSYSWNTGDTVRNINGLSPGNYYLTVTDRNGCMVSDSVEISVLFELTASIFGTDVSCSGNSDGEADLTVQVDQINSIFRVRSRALFAYQWSTGDTTEDIDQLTAGIYYVTVSDSFGCTDSASVTINQPDSIPITDIRVSICQGASYFVGGAEQTVPGIYFDTLQAANGCDSIIATILTILPNTSTTINASICDGDSYFASGADQTTSGTYYDSLTAENGCDSVVITNLTVLTIFTTTIDVSICDGQSYFAGGADQPSSGIYYDTLIAQNGCDSVVTTNLTVLSLFTTTVDISICDGQSYFAGGADQTSSGIYYDTLTAQNGCDSVVTTNLTVLALFTTTVDIRICDGQSYFAGGGDQTNTGIYYDTLSARNGCDSVVITNLAVLSLFTTTVDISICDGESHFAEGADQTNSGTYYDTLSALNGCDSVVITNLTVLSLFTTTVDISICDGKSHFAEGADQTNSGTYYDTLSAQNGCDSVVITNLTVLSLFTTTVDISICDGESHFTGGADQTNSGTFNDTLSALNGCDSVVITNLTVLSLFTATVDISICDGVSYFVGGADQTSAGTYYDTLIAQNGCDSIVTTSLTILSHVSTSINASICDGETYFAGGGNQTASGIYYDTTTAQNGCDSVVITNLMVMTHASTILNVSICDGENHFTGGADQTTAGTYYDTLMAVNGCDSIIITELSVLSNATTIMAVSICQGDSIFVGGGYQKTSGTYRDTLSGINRCDSIVITELLVSITLNTSLLINDITCGISCSGSMEVLALGGIPPLSYQWNAGATSSVIDSLCSGQYTVTVTDSTGCSGIDQGIITELQGLQSNVIVNGIMDDCSCGNYVSTEEICLLNFASLAHGTLLNDQYTDQGIHITAEAYGDGISQLIIFNSDVSGSQDPDLEAGIGNLAIFPTSLSDQDGDGLVDAPNDYHAGGKQIYSFDEPRTVISFVFVDKENNTATATAYDEFDQAILSVSIPALGNGSAQTITMNAEGASKLVIDYFYDSGGVTELLLGCGLLCCNASATATVTGGVPPFSYLWSNGSATPGIDSLCPGTYIVTITDNNGCNVVDTAIITELEELDITTTHSDVSADCAGSANQLCQLSFSDLPAGTILNEQYSDFGIHISAEAYGNSIDQLILFNSNASGTPDPDMELGIGNLAIFPANLIDNNGDGLVDDPDDNFAGGKQIYTFDTERTVQSFLFVDKENNPGTATVYNGTDQVIKTVNIPAIGNGSTQTISVNASGVRKLVIDYFYDSGGITDILFECNPVCCDGTAGVSVSGGIAPFTYLWSTGESTPQIDSLCAGSYMVTVTDQTGCSETANLVISDPPAENFRRSLVNSIHSNAESLDIKIYPVPFDNTLIIEANSNLSSRGNISILDVVGRTLIKTDIDVVSGHNSFVLKIGQPLPTGIYILKLKLNNQVFQKKIFKN